MTGIVAGGGGIHRSKYDHVCARGNRRDGVGDGVATPRVEINPTVTAQQAAAAAAAAEGRCC